MAVVINEFEVIAEPAARSVPKTSENEGADMPPPGPEAIARALRELHERNLRVWAH